MSTYYLSHQLKLPSPPRRWQRSPSARHQRLLRVDESSPGLPWHPERKNKYKTQYEEYFLKSKHTFIVLALLTSKRPFETSQRGDSGMKAKPISCSKDGTPARPSIHFHPCLKYFVNLMIKVARLRRLTRSWQRLRKRRRRRTARR